MGDFLFCCWVIWRGFFGGSCFLGDFETVVCFGDDVDGDFYVLTFWGD